MGNLKRSSVESFKTLQLLYKINKPGYSRLKKENSDLEYLFNLGETLGDDDINRKEIFIKAEVAKETLESLIESSIKYLKKIKVKIEGYKKIELAFQILTALGGSAILITLTNGFKENPQMHFNLQLIGSIIATVGSLLSVFLNKGLGGWSFNRRNRVQDYDNLVLYNIEAAKLMRRLIPKLQIYDNLKDITEVESIINETEDLSSKVQVIIHDYS